LVGEIFFFDLTGILSAKIDCWILFHTL